jgi:hypothetical protein
MTADERKHAAEVAALISTLQGLRNGGAIADLAEQLRDVVKNVRTTGRPGALLFTLKIKPAQKGGDHHALILEDTLKVTLPKAERGGTILYATDDNQLTRNDPRQPELKGLREVPAPTPIAVSELRDPLAPSQQPEHVDAPAAAAAGAGGQ